MKIALLRATTALAFASLASCGGDSGGGSPTPPPVVNSPPVIGSGNAEVSVAENSSGNVFVVTASDANGDALTYSLTGADASSFAITASGAVTFVESPNFDLPTDSNRDNLYEFAINVSDGKSSATAQAKVTVQNEKEGVAVTRLTRFEDTGLVASTIDRSAGLLAVRSNGQLLNIDSASGTIEAVGNAFLNGESGRVLAAYQDRIWIFTVLEVEGIGILVRFNSARYAFSSRPTVLLTNRTGSNAKASFVINSGFLGVAVGDPDGSAAQESSQGSGKLFKLNFDPYCGASLDTVCLTGDMIGDGIHAPTGGGAVETLAFLVDRGTDQQDEVTSFDPTVRPLDFGWPYREGTYVRVANPPEVINGPFLTFERGEDFGRSQGLVGGALYTGSITSLADRLLLGDTSGRIFAVPRSFATDGVLHTGVEAEDRTLDFTPDDGAIDEVRQILTLWDGTIIIVDADGEVFRVSGG